MRLSVAQTRPIVGDIERNLAGHQSLIERASAAGADIVVFPELSLTGQEPGLAVNLATTLEDDRFERLQEMSDSRGVSIGVGMPTHSLDGVYISMLIFQPREVRHLYSKAYLHPDEEPFFAAGPVSNRLIGPEADIAIAICFELSVAEHAARAFKNGAKCYIASAAKSANGSEIARNRLSAIAREYKMTVLMANCVGLLDGTECSGGSSAWDREGNLLAQLDEASEGLIVVDSDTHEVFSEVIAEHR